MVFFLRVMGSSNVVAQDKNINFKDVPEWNYYEQSFC
jgi:hypothetical protein